MSELQNSRAEGCSKFGCKLDEHVNNSKINKIERLPRWPTFNEGCQKLKITVMDKHQKSEILGPAYLEHFGKSAME